MVRLVRLGPSAVEDMRRLYEFIAGQASPAIAKAYIGRISAVIARLDHLSERGVARDDIRPGLRLIGFERRVNIAYLIEDDEVIVLRVLYAGRGFDSEA